MVTADWGVDQEESWFSAHWPDRDPVDSDSADDLAQVATARQQGYVPADDAPHWCFLPALWPRGARAWTRDRRVRHKTTYGPGDQTQRLPWSAADYFDIEEEINALLAELGLPPRPAGRIWLLRPLAPNATVDELLDDIWTAWTAGGGLACATAEFVAYVDGRLRELS